MYRLPNDIARCSGTKTIDSWMKLCPLRKSCLRYLAGKEQNDMNAVVPFMEAPTVSGECRMYIPTKNEE